MTTSSNHRPIFVMGCPRSGTTMLQLMLHSHPRLATPNETKFMRPAYTRRLQFGDLREPENRRRFGEWLVNGKHHKFKELRLDKAQTVEEIVAAPPTLGSLLAAVFRSYARSCEKERWGDKRPSYFQHVGELQRLFPDAQFVHLIRDGRDAVGSLKEMPWFQGDFFSAVSIWREAIDSGRRYAKELGPDTYYELQYENLCVDPESELRGLCGFLGEEYDPAMTEHHRLAQETVPAGTRQWHARTHNQVDAQRVGSWHKRLTSEEIALAEAVLGSRLERYGYELSDAGRPPARMMAEYTRAAGRRRLRRVKWAVNDFARQRREPGPVASLLTGSALQPSGITVPRQALARQAVPQQAQQAQQVDSPGATGLRRRPVSETQPMPLIQPPVAGQGSQGSQAH